MGGEAYHTPSPHNTHLPSKWLRRTIFCGLQLIPLNGTPAIGELRGVGTARKKQPGAATE